MQRKGTKGLRLEEDLLVQLEACSDLRLYLISSIFRMREAHSATAVLYCIDPIGAYSSCEP